MVQFTIILNSIFNPQDIVLYKIKNMKYHDQQGIYNLSGDSGPQAILEQMVRSGNY